MQDLELQPVQNEADTVVTTDVEEAETIVAVPETKIEKAEAWTEGLLPIDRPGHTGHDQGAVTVIVVLLLGICLSFKNMRRVFAVLTKRLLSKRIHQGFDETTVDEKRSIGLLLVVTVFFLGLLVTAGLSSFVPGEFSYTFATILRAAGVVGAYFVGQYIVYRLLGYTFADEGTTKLWIEGFTASMSLLGLGLLIPGIVVLFYPDVTREAVWVGAGLYVLARIMFICKGFRIFYTNWGSLLYFILYLCTLEIIPISILYHLAEVFCANQT